MNVSFSTFYSASYAPLLFENCLVYSAHGGLFGLQFIGLSLALYCLYARQ